MAGTYEDITFISERNFATVWEASNENQTSVALKKIPLQKNVPTKDHISECYVLQCLAQTTNPNIVRLVDSPYIHDDHLCLPFELAEEHLGNRIPSLLPRETKRFLYQIINGCNGFHPLIVHRDLKPENILIFDNSTAKIADFGLAKALLSLGIELTPFRGTLGYRAPEVLLGSTQYGPPVDMWSVGCIFFKMLTCEPFLPGTNTLGDLKMIQMKLGKFTKRNMPVLSSFNVQDLKKIRPDEGFKGLGDVLDDIQVDCPDAIDLLRRLLAINPEERITAEDALYHSYFDIDDDGDDY